MLKGTRKKLIAILFAMVMVFGIFALSGFYKDKTVSAETGEVMLSPADYTDSDNLLKENGEWSEITIVDFAQDVYKATNGTSFPEITQVIPKQYMESEEDNATFAYNGKEYGFYVVKEGNYFDVLLIDFVYEFDQPYSDLAYKIRIKPIMEESFARTKEIDGSYTWKKIIEPRYRYYVANPRFMSQVLNENALNYGAPTLSLGRNDD